MRHPSTVINVPWLWARSHTARYVDPAKVGKWLIFCPIGDVDNAWACIEDATVADELGPLSKVSTAWNLAPTRVICVYTRDYGNMDDVRRVLGELRALEFTERLSYKEDSATRARLYGPGSTLYTSYSGTDIQLNRNPVAA
jgi:hypothetical protein